MANSFFRKALETKEIAYIYDVPPILLTDTELNFVKACKAYQQKYNGTIPEWSVIVDKYPFLSIIPLLPTPLDYQRDNWYELRKKELANSLALELQGAIEAADSAEIRQIQNKLSDIYRIDTDSDGEDIRDVDLSEFDVDPILIPTGIWVLDNQFGGLAEDETLGIFARPGVGKTTISIFLAWLIVSQQNKRVLYISGEQYYKQVRNRYFCIQAGFNPRALRGHITSDTRQAIATAKDQIQAKNQTIVFYKGKRNLASINAHMSKHAGEYDLVIIDAIYKIKTSASTSKEDKENVRIAAMIQELTGLVATEWRVPVIYTSQINREGELAGSDAFNQESSFILELRPNSLQQTKGWFDCVMLKTRNSSDISGFSAFRDSSHLRFEFYDDNGNGDQDAN